MAGPWRRGKCTACDQPVIWAFTEQNKRTPVDPIPDETGTIELTGSLPRAHVMSKRGRWPGQKLYVSHWHTCPHAETFRAKRVRSEPVPVEQDALFGGAR